VRSRLSSYAINAVSRMGESSSASALYVPLASHVWRGWARPSSRPRMGGQMSLTSPFASSCGGVSMMTCPRCDGLLVREHLLNLREGPCPAFMGRGD